MRLAVFDSHRLGVVDEDHIVDVTDTIAGPPDAAGPLHRLIESRGPLPAPGTRTAPIPLHEVRTRAPLPRPPKIIGAPVNYADHQAEMAVSRSITELGIFLKAASSVIGPRERVRLPYSDVRTDQEGELAVVIGRTARNVAADDALEYVFGYTCALDITVRSTEDRSTRKSFDTFTPLGPWVVTADEVPDPGNLTMRCRVDGELRQETNTGDLIFGVADLIRVHQFRHDALARGRDPHRDTGRRRPHQRRGDDLRGDRTDRPARRHRRRERRRPVRRSSGAAIPSHGCDRAMTRIAVVGGGPGGLLAAALIRERRPDTSVDLFERNGPDESFGFGVVFSAAKLSRLHGADLRLGSALRENGVHWDDIEIRLEGERMRCAGQGFSAISRRNLLALLRDRAHTAGVGLRYHTEVDALDLEDTHDLVVGADGLNSRTRQAHAESFRPTIEMATARYIWFGADRAFDSMTFLFERAEAGWFAAHAYPYDDFSSTFVVECDESTWRRSGLDSVGELPPGHSDEPSRIAMQRLFADGLDGARLLTNNSRWARFSTVRAGSWCHDRTVLIGDAAHTAHFSVGSGTTMAIEDALALADAVATASDAELPDAIRTFEHTRRPGVARIQDAALPSLTWWEHFGSYTGLDPRQFAVHFLTRSGRVTFDRLAAGDARFGAEALRRHNVPDSAAVLRLPLRLGGHTLPDRTPTETALVDACPQALWITAPSHTGSVPDVLDDLEKRSPAPPLIVVRAAGTDPVAHTAALLLAELTRIRAHVPVALVVDTTDVEHLATLLLAGRADLLVVPDDTEDTSRTGAVPGAHVRGKAGR
ncbi:fumarylacetoacetate hydrolase family protein [Embleya hyalina]|uniref:Salicylyl-CoA 5-hydroxylase n=1 Tax=Embleya hyalina TaxID=516124 RepID=A0A401YQZ6_9ACTN|nr:fumarylacetoacetate hydrolase family protein [Embleya hyalina]GCD97013.1 salicylyl-CoA 5-hydroxylase [Embleya hyalina]